MNIEDKVINVALSYNIYLEKKKSLEVTKMMLNNDLYNVCSHFTCNNCPVVNICAEVGRKVKTGDEDE